MCIATHRRQRLLTACLDSLGAQVDPPSFEVLVAADLDPRIDAVVGGRFPLASVGQMSDERGVRLASSDKRNALVAQARGDLLLFLDDDVVCDPHLLRTLVDLAAAHPDVAVFGGPNITPPGSSLVQMVQGAVLGSIVAAGPVRRRWGRHPAGDADDRYFTLCNMAVRRAHMVPFPLGMFTGEEIAVLNELRRNGCRMHYDPELLVYHERRPTVAGFARQIFNYGRGRGRVARRDPGSVRADHIAPILLVAYVVASPVLAFVHWGFLVPLGVYALAVAAQAVKIGASLRRGIRATALAAVLVVVVHLWYGAGIVAGIVGPGPPQRRTSSTWADANA